MNDNTTSEWEKEMEATGYADIEKRLKRGEGSGVTSGWGCREAGPQPDGTEAHREDSGVGKTVEQSKCPHCAGGYHVVATSCGFCGMARCASCGGTGQRSGLPNVPAMGAADTNTPPAQ